MRDITENQIAQAIKKNPRLIIDLYSPDCDACAMLMESLRELERARPDIAIYTVDVDRDRKVAEKLKIRNTVPTLLYIENSNLLSKQVGAVDGQTLIQMCERIYG